MKLTVPPKSLQLLLALSLFSAAPAVLSAINAGEDAPPGNSHDETERHFLLEVLEEQTRIATKTGLNADYVPGIVTILHGTDLERRGLRTVWEALALVPGVNLSIEPSGRRQVTVRGIGGSLRSGKIKLLLNHVPMNSAKFAQADPVLNIPIEQIERIEVIRGPGSAVHGEFAFAGVINVLTRQQDQGLFIATGSHDSRSAGASGSFKEGALELGISLSGLATDGADVTAGPDALYSAGLGALSNAPGPANEERQAGAAVFNLGYRGFSLLGQIAGEAYGDHFGLNQILPPDPDRLAQREQSQTLEVRQIIPLGTSLQANLSAGRVRDREERNGVFIGPPEAHGGISGDPDVYLNGLHLETREYGAVELRWSAAKAHAVLLSASYSDTRVDSSWVDLNLDVDYTPSDNFLRVLSFVDTSRIIRSATIQDEYRLNDSFTLTSGLRYDDYSDVGQSVTPRIAGVWRRGERHVFKAQYGEAFRPPTFTELSIDAGIKAEEIATYELGYILKGMRNDLRFTLFHSELKNLITVDDSGGPQYRALTAISKGAELELVSQLAASWRLDSSVSYVDAREEPTAQPVPASVHWLGNLGVLFEPKRSMTIAAQYRYVGESHREPLDPRPALNGYQTVDLTVNVNHRTSKGMVYRFGVKNLLNQDVRYPSPLTNGPPPDREPIVAYESDLPRPGRTWWAQAAYRF